MEVLNYFPEDIRSVILSLIPFTLDEVNQHRKSRTVSHLLDKAVKHLKVPNNISLYYIVPFSNLEMVQGLIEVTDAGDLSGLYRLTSYDASFYSHKLLATFLSLVPVDHFKRGYKQIIVTGHRFYFQNGQFSFNIYYPMVSEELFRILIERQLFDGITIDDDDTILLGDLLNSISGLKNITLFGYDRGFPDIVKLSNIWTQVEEVNLKLSFKYVPKLIEMLRQRYRTLPNVKSFKSRVNVEDAKLLFPNLVDST